MSVKPTMNKTQTPLRMPPKIPGGLEPLQRVIMLLGHRAKGPLHKKFRKEIEELIGTYPDTEGLAAEWKSAMKSIVKKLKENQISSES